MCRIEERTYISANGHRKTFEDLYTCDNARGDKLCKKVKRRQTEYNHQRGSNSRDDTPSPLNPPTPTGSGTYLVQQRRPSGSGSRPTTRDGQKAIKPEIVIQIGSKKEKGKYSSVSVSTKPYSRSSLGASSVGSNDAAVESPGSDTSYPIRTGFPDAPLPPPAAFSQPGSYIATPSVPRGGHHRHTSSASSSRTPSLYVTSDDYDSPASQRTAKYPSTIVHNPSTTDATSPSRRQAATYSSAYRTSTIAPQGFSQETHTQDGLYPLDYADFADRSASSHASSGAPEITRRPKSSDERRRKNEEVRRRQEERDRQVAQELEKAENVKQVRFELGRADARAAERAEKAFAEKEKDRAAAREEARKRDARKRQEEERLEEKRLEQDKKEREERKLKERKKEKSKPPTTDFNKRPSGSRRMSASMTPAQLAEQRRLLAAEGLQMQSEKEAAEARERDERNAAVRYQQETPGYYDPRGGDRTLSNNTASMSRRNSITRHDSVASTERPFGLSRTGSKRRNSVTQSNPPPIITQVPVENYSTRPPSARTRAPPPLSFPSNFNQDYDRPPPSARRPSFTQENPFAAPPTRGSGSNVDNPFTPQPSVMSTSAVNDPWDMRTVQDALPNTRPPLDPRYNSMQQRGEAVINRSASHRAAAQQATRAMGRAAGYGGEYETDSDSLGSEGAAHLYASRTGQAKKKY